MLLSPNSVTLKNGLEKDLIGRQRYVLVWRGCDHTHIEHSSYVL